MSPRLFLPAAAFIVLGATPAGAVLLVHDDGTAETTFGAYSSIDTIWLVHYNTPDLTPYWAVSDVGADRCLRAPAADRRYRRATAAVTARLSHLACGAIRMAMAIRRMGFCSVPAVA